MNLPVIIALGDGIALAVLLMGSLVFALLGGVFAVVTRRMVLARTCGAVIIIHGVLASLPLLEDGEDNAGAMLLYALILAVIGLMFILLRRKKEPNQPPVPARGNGT